MVTLWRLETHMLHCLWKYYPELAFLDSVNSYICSQIYDASILSYIVLFVLFKTRMLFVRTNCYFCITNG